MASSPARKGSKPTLPLRIVTSPYTSSSDPQCCVPSPIPVEYTAPTKKLSLRKKALTWITKIKSPPGSPIGTYGPAIEHRPNPPTTPNPPMLALRSLSKYSRDVLSLDGCTDTETTLRTPLSASSATSGSIISRKTPRTPISPMMTPNGVKISIFPPRNAPPTPPQFSPFSLASPQTPIFGLEVEDTNTWVSPESPPCTPPHMSPLLSPTSISSRPLTCDQHKTSNRILENAARKIIAADAQVIEAARKEWGPAVETIWGRELTWLKTAGTEKKKKRNKKKLVVRTTFSFLKRPQIQQPQEEEEVVAEDSRAKYLWGNISQEALNTLRGQVWAGYA
ncbi:hypothetical protein RUND412_010058 [Rhizina undulata]